ncbi:MAG: hypothetical protein ACYSSI_08905 [Planctomycetota bacterium]|jgi:hypothetical protein
MSEESNNLPQQRNYSTIIIAVTIVLLAVIFMFFRDRQQKRQLQLERMDTQMDVLEEWRPPRQNTASKGGGKIL